MINDKDFYGLNDDDNNLPEDNKENVIETIDNNIKQDNNSNNEEPDVIQRLLLSKGILDPSKIKYENENGEIEERNWNDLDDDNKFNILSHNDLDEDYGLSDDEIDLINLIRSKGLTSDEFINSLKSEPIEKEQSISLDDYTDDEWYDLDLQIKFPDMSEEERQELLNHDKANDSIFSKKIELIKQEYTKLIEEKTQADLAARQEQTKREWEEYENNISEAINNFSDVGGFELTPTENDMNDIYNFIVGSDKANVRYLAKALNDPQTLVKMAWFAIKGDDMLQGIQDYYNNEIKNVAKTNYDKGLAYGLKQINPGNKLVINKNNKQNNIKGDIFGELN